MWHLLWADAVHLLDALNLTLYISFSRDDVDN